MKAPAAPLSKRSDSIGPFFVMELVKEAEELERAGRSILHLSIGEPDFTAPEPVVEAARIALQSGRSRYTPALGTNELRAAISGFYRDRFGLEVEPERIVVTAGGSGALVLLLSCLLDPGDELLLPDPSYPCNRHIASALGARARLIACGPQQRFHLNAAVVEAAWSPRSRAVLIGSPSNPTGTTIDSNALAQLSDWVLDRGGFVLVDEIYQGLTYDHAPATALALDSRVAVINSFSKYFGMTGWRLGWIVAPRAWVGALERLSQNLYLCPSAVAQHAALACFGQSCLATCEQRREEFRRRRDFIVPALRQLGFQVPVLPDGAFYVYADIQALTRTTGNRPENSMQFARRLLNEAGVCLVPGDDFGEADAERYVRLSYAASMDHLQQAIERIRAWLGRG
jgi:aspartate/methionine/tyrosine aminotransferase